MIDSIKGKPIRFKIGIGIVILSLLTYLIPFIIPFLPFSVGEKAMYITGVLVVAEVLFWIGVLLVGKEVAMKIKGYLSPKKWGKRAEIDERRADKE